MLKATINAINYGASLKKAILSHESRFTAARIF